MSEETYLAFQIICFLSGVAIYAILIFLIWKAEKIKQHALGSLFAAGLGLLWNLAGLLRQYQILIGTNTVAYRLALAFTYSVPGLLPVAILLIQTPRWRSQNKQRAHQIIFRLSIANALIWSALIFLSVVWLRSRESTRAFFSCSLICLLIFGLLDYLLLRGADAPTPGSLRFYRALLLGAVCLALGLLLAFLLGFRFSTTSLLTLFVQQVSIPIAVAALFLLGSRYRFTDLLVKNSLIFLTALLISLLGTVVLKWMIINSLIGDRYDRVLLWMATVVASCALLLCYPRLKAAVVLGADRFLFRRPDYQSVINRFDKLCDEASDEQNLFALTKREVGAALETDLLSIEPLAQLPHEVVTAIVRDKTEGGGTELFELARVKLAEDGHRQLAEFRWAIPVRTDHAAAYALLLGATERKFLSEEVAFLRAVAERVGRRIETINFERERRKRETREATLQHQLTEAELKALRFQINPHFLFNTLNTIADLATSDSCKAEAMIERLAEFFRYTLESSHRSYITVVEEFGFLRNYLLIERERFGDRLQVEFFIDPLAGNQVIPPLLLQPIVENSIKHGLARNLKGGKVEVRAEQRDNSLILTVRDDGAGCMDLSDRWVNPSKSSEQAPPPNVSDNNSASAGGGVGLKNVVERLAVTFGERARCVVQSSPGQGTLVTITIAPK